MKEKEQQTPQNRQKHTITFLNYQVDLLEARR